MLKKKKFFIGGIIVFLAIASLGYVGFQNSATYYYTVSEFTEPENLVYNENVRLQGQVAPGTVEQSALGTMLKFTVTEGDESLPVIYQGVVPDTFKADSEIVIEGSLDSEGIFQADVIMPKCPSRYAPQT